MKFKHQLPTLKKKKTASANYFFEKTPNYARGEIPIDSKTSGCLKTCLEIYEQNVEAKQFHHHWEHFNRLCHAILNIHSTGKTVDKTNIIEAIQICCSVLNDSEEITRQIGNSLIQILAMFVQDLKESKQTLEKEDLLTLMDHYSKIKMSLKNYEMANEISDHMTTILDSFGEELMKNFEVVEHLQFVASYCHIIMNQSNDEIVRSFCIRLVCTFNSLEKDKLSAILAGIRRSKTEDELVELLSQILRKILFAQRYHTQLWILEVVLSLTQNFSMARNKAYELMMSIKERNFGLGLNVTKLFDLKGKFNDIPPHIALESYDSLHEKYDDFLNFLNNVARTKATIFTVAGKVVQVNDTKVNEEYGADAIEFNSLAGCVSFLTDMKEMAKIFVSEQSQVAGYEGEAYFEAFYENFVKNEKADGTMQITLEIRRLMYKQGLNGQMEEIENISSVILIVEDSKEKGFAYDDSKKFIQGLQNKISTKPVNLDASLVTLRTATSATSLASEPVTPSVQKKLNKVAKKALKRLKKSKKKRDDDEMNDEEMVEFRQNLIVQVLEKQKAMRVSKLFDSIVEQLLEFLEGSQSNLKAVAYEALMQFIQSSPNECRLTVQMITIAVYDRIHQVPNIDDMIPASDRQKIQHIQSSLSATLQSVMENVDPHEAPIVADLVMSAFLMMFQSSSGKTGGVQEDAFMAVSNLCDLLKSNYELCQDAIGLVGDIALALKTGIVPYCDEIMNMLMQTLSNPEIHRDVKPQVLSVIGDLALSIGGEFEKHLESVLEVLMQAMNLQFDQKDFEMPDYFCVLRESVLEAYTRIVQGLKGTDQKSHLDINLLQGHVPLIIKYVVQTAQDPGVSETTITRCAGLIGELCLAFGAPILPYILEDNIVTPLLMEGKKSSYSRTESTCDWALREIKILMNSKQTTSVRTSVKRKSDEFVVEAVKKPKMDDDMMDSGDEGFWNSSKEFMVVDSF